MKKFYLMFFALVCSFTMLQAQAWYVYDGSTIPDELSEWSASSDYPGINFVEEVTTDHYSLGNTYFSYYAPDDVASADASRSASKYYKLSLAGKTDSLTFVTRFKGDSVSGVDSETAFQFEFVVSGCVVREVVSIIPDDNKIKLEKSGGSVVVDSNFFDWHILRVTFDGSDSTTSIYIDEQATAVYTGQSTAAPSKTTDNYFRFGDAGSQIVAGSMDWLVIDTTGAYAPGEGAAIPTDLSTNYGPETGKYYAGAGIDLAFVTIKSTLDTNGIYADTFLVERLANEGFNVSVVDFSDESDSDATLDSDNKTAVEAADVVVLSRTIGSKVLTAQKAYWAGLNLPVVSLNTYSAQSNKMGWLPTENSVYGADFTDLSAKVLVPEDTIFSSISVPSDSVISFCSDFISFLTLTSDEMAMLPESAEVLLTMTNGPVANYYKKTSTVDKTIDFSRFCTADTIVPLMIRWAPEDSMYTSSGGEAARPFHYRTYIPGGDDHKAVDISGTDTQIYGMNIYSDDMISLIANECAYLSTLEGIDASDVYTLDTIIVSVGTLDPTFDSEVTSYTLEVPSGTTSLTVGATQTDPNASISGTGTYTLDGSDTTIVITCTSEAGTAQEYAILVKEEVEVAGNIIPPGTDNISTYIEENTDYDLFYLYNDSTYLERSPIYITRKVTLMAKDTVTLPALDNLPVIMPARTSTSFLFQLGEGADLTLFGIECDGDGTAEGIITMEDVDGEANYEIEGINIVRCRLHNVSTDIIDACSDKDTVIVKSALFTNSFVYDATEHGLYLKDCYLPNEGTAEYVYDNLTFWNLGEQLEWIQIMLMDLDDDHLSTWTFDHCTGYDLSVSSENKELIGNSSKGGQYDVTLTNCIFSEQGSTEVQSLYFTQYNLYGDDNVFTISNVALHNCSPIDEREDTDDITYDNIYTDDPAFASPDDGDFTLGNTDYETGATDGSALGALYWVDGYVDDYADYAEYTAVESTTVSEIPVTVYPMPFNEEITFSIDADLAGTATISIFDISGRTVSVTNISLIAGTNEITLEAGDIQAGTYFYNIATDSQNATGQLIKVN